MIKAKDADTGKKLFLNLCQNDMVGVATAVPCADGEKVGQKWSIPYSLAPPREEVDSGVWVEGGEGSVDVCVMLLLLAPTEKRHCMVYDIVFHTSTYEKGEKAR